MNAHEVNDVDAQIVTRGRAEFLLVELGHRPVWYRDLFEQYGMSLEAVEENENSERYTECSLWPSEFFAVREIILHITKLDNEIK